VADRLSDSDLRHLATNAYRLRLKRNINRRLVLMAESQPDSRVAYFKSAPPDLHFLACPGRNTFRQLLAILERPPYLVDWLGFARARAKPSQTKYAQFKPSATCSYLVRCRSERHRWSEPLDGNASQVRSRRLAPSLSKSRRTNTRCVHRLAEPMFSPMASGGAKARMD
jgi:hypothetical protein